MDYVYMLKELKPDIVSICTPTNTHFEILEHLLKIETGWKPKLVICEKPFCSNHKEAKAISTLYKHAKIPLLIDYIRRFDKIMMAFRENIKSERAHACRIIYGRGLKRDGCHGLDICNYLFGANIILTNPLLKYTGIEDGEPGDFSIPLYGAWEHCSQIIFTPVDSRDYSVFEIDVLTEAGHYQFIDNGLQLIFHGKDQSVFGDYASLSNVPDYSQTALNIALLTLMDNAVKYLKQQSPLLCTDRDAVKVWEMMKGVM